MIRHLCPNEESTLTSLVPILPIHSYHSVIHYVLYVVLYIPHDRTALFLENTEYKIKTKPTRQKRNFYSKEHFLPKAQIYLCLCVEFLA